jgi:hypothetical protein
MKIRINLGALNFVEKVKAYDARKVGYLIVALSAIVAAAASYYYFDKGYLVSYGDAESHLNIAKRVIHSLTPGFAQLGGIWLPIPHVLMIPFVSVDFLWRSGLAGSIVSGLAFVVSALYLYRLGLLLTGAKAAGVIAAIVFIFNPNVLYLQSTPMTELPLLAFFTMSSYYFIKYIIDDKNIVTLILAAFFGFCATLSRYDGWFLVAMQAGVLALLYFPYKTIPKNLWDLKTKWDKQNWQKLEGLVLMFSTVAFFGILLWLAWDFLILGDPLYFTHSQFSAKSQQQSWLARGELPSYQNVWQSFLYYFVTSMSNAGVIIFGIALLGLFYYMKDKNLRMRWYILLVLLVPFIFNVLTLYMGQSVIFIPHITPTTFEWTLFNVRYGVMLVPTVAIIIGYLFYKVPVKAKAAILAGFVLQAGLFGLGYSKVISLEDGVAGLSSASAKIPDAQYWITDNYDHGLVLVDDFARTLSIVRSRIPMQNVIYVGNKPYWEESLKEPEKHARWIIMQKDDEVWNNILDRPEIEGRLYKYFEKAYTSPEILVFKRNAVPLD